MNATISVLIQLIHLQKGGTHLIIIDYNDKRPIYKQIVERFQSLILNGVLEADTQLPSVRSLAIELSINANTIQRAYSELEQNGYIYSVKGRGNFVLADESLIFKQRDALLKNFRKITGECQSSGLSKDELIKEISLIYTEVTK